MLKPKKILVPTDFSAYSDKALRQALDIAIEYGAKVYVIHVMRADLFDSVGDYIIPMPTVEQVKDHVLAAVKENLQKQISKFPQALEVEVITDICTGLHYETILKEAEKRGIDLIVIASLGRSGVAKYLVGGVARNILKGAKCPVLLTK
jgi:universal stress protein A